MKKQIIALGNGGLNSKNPLLDFYILAQSQKKNPKICLLPTASGDDRGLVKYFLDVYSNWPCEPSVLTLFNPHTADIKGFLMEQDIVFVSGGQSKSMLGCWDIWGIGDMLSDAYHNGTILAGSSAGSVCWFDTCITDSIPGTLSVMPALGILPFSNCPHYSSESRREAYKHYITTNQIEAGYACDDDAGAHFVDGKWHRSIAIGDDLSTFKVGMVNGEFVQEQLPTQNLNDETTMSELIFNSPTFDF
jgi:dipeptidase E